ncbi:PASTA domain-containing protein [Nocardioides KLBMP 9356]|uniref:PASTA domain-containing protein n=1 Tax=Nocardioides potassii TaxID=2911371 RepID=A0ABS9HDP0_9ACTN|nr:PASTA domain-containing protein [Nocardioides potassii]MCF6378402.1 PASTA domain-containing protein [Nocardioides potassii]
MDLEDYRAARHHHLVEVAAGLGVPADRAAEVVDRVIEAQRRRILRSADPDEVVVPALRDEVLGRPSRGPTLAIAALVVVVAAAFAVPLLTAGPDPEEVERKAGTMPSLVGLTSEEAVVALRSIGIASRIDPVPQCDPAGQVLGSVPPAGGAVRPEQVVTVVATATPAWTCPRDTVQRDEAWAFLRFLVSGSGRPRLAREVRLYVDGQPAGTADGRQPATAPDWRWRVRDPVVASVVRPVANDLGQPVVSITRGPLPPVTCAVPTPRPSGVGPDPTRVVLTADADPREDGQGEVCQLTIDLFEDVAGAIAVVSVVIPGGTGLGPPPWVRTRDDLDDLDGRGAADGG